MAESVNVSYEAAITNWLLIKEYLQDRKVPVLIDVSKGFKASMETMRFGTSTENNHNRSAIAYLVKEEDYSKENFAAYKSKYTQPIPSEIFLNKDDALNWLSQFI